MSSSHPHAHTHTLPCFWLVKYSPSNLCLCIICVCMYVYMYVCIYTCMYVCMYICMYICVYVCMYTHKSSYSLSCLCVCIIHKCVCMYVCMYACMHACIYLCVYAYVQIHVISLSYLCLCIAHVCMHVYIQIHIPSPVHVLFTCACKSTLLISDTYLGFWSNWVSGFLKFKNPAEGFWSNKSPYGRTPSCCFITLGTTLGNQQCKYTFYNYCIFLFLSRIGSPRSVLP